MSAYKLVRHKGKQRELHAVIAEAVLGRSLPGGAVVHHQDGNPLNNEKNNLVICPSQGYHRLLHARLRAFLATGNPDLRTCKICKVFDARLNMKPSDKNETSFYHRSCKAAYDKEHHANLKTAVGRNNSSGLSSTARD